MRYVDEYRDPDVVAALAARILRRTRVPWTIMEVCGGQTHAILASGFDALDVGRASARGSPTAGGPGPAAARACASAA